MLLVLDQWLGGTVKNYKYHIEEYSQDVRLYLVESDEKLTEEEIHEAFPEVELTDGATSITEKGIKVTFEGTEYGDDSQVNIDGEVKSEV
jgi:predicted nucleotidyltransferase|tara:strand:+ start:75 stop:344 length:270 start_codon:yes stop_codon:yes gene_type:complete